MPPGLWTTTEYFDTFYRSCEFVQLVLRIRAVPDLASSPFFVLCLRANSSYACSQIGSTNLTWCFSGHQRAELKAQLCFDIMPHERLGSFFSTNHAPSPKMNFNARARKKGFFQPSHSAVEILLGAHDKPRCQYF